MHAKNKQPRNKAGIPHGRWEVYWTDGTLYCSGHYIDGEFWCNGHYYCEDGTDTINEYYAS